jgi:hypothetical protein
LYWFGYRRTHHFLRVSLTPNISPTNTNYDFEGGTVDSVAAGMYHTCMVTSHGAVLCTGWNQFGQLGDSTIVTKSIFVRTFGLTSGISMVQVGYTFTCALVIADGSVLWYVVFDFQNRTSYLYAAWLCVVVCDVELSRSVSDGKSRYEVGIVCTSNSVVVICQFSTFHIRQYGVVACDDAIVPYNLFCRRALYTFLT